MMAQQIIEAKPRTSIAPCTMGSALRMRSTIFKFLAASRTVGCNSVKNGFGGN